MHFIREACNRRSLESRTLTYSRGATAILMGFLFLGYCIYLIFQMYNNQPLLQISSETIGYYSATPDVEVCAQNSTLTVVKCAVMYYNWTMADIPNCFEKFFRSGANNEFSKCYIFESNDTFRMSRGITYDDRDAFRRIDFYWNIDALLNMTYSSISIPAIAIQLYSPTFSSWKVETIGNTEIETNTMANMISGGISTATSLVNYSTAIFYHPQKYRAIKPGDISTLFGFASNFIDIVTLAANTFTWPIQLDPPPPAFDRKLYQGVFSVQLDQDTFDVKTEVIQHSIVSSIALAGGCYSVLTTIYVILFGMSKLSPWGIAHHIPNYIGKNDEHQVIQANEYHNNKRSTYTHDKSSEKINTTKENNYSFNGLFKWIFKRKNPRIGVLSTKNDLQLEKLTVTSPTNYSDRISEVVYSAPESSTSYSPPHYNRVGQSSDNSLDFKCKVFCQETKELNALKKETALLSSRMEEMEFILSEYFINTKYLEQLRRRKKSMSSHLDNPESFFD